MRIILYIAMQLAVLVVVSIVGSIIMSVLGISIDGQSSVSLLVMCAIYGCAGSIISLFLSKTMCKKSYGVQVITRPRNAQEQFLVQTVQRLTSQAGLAMPEVGIYQSNDPNAFATGASKNAALVAVSTGLLNSMSQEEVAGVLGHEVSHIKNGDMVTMALLQGVLNTFVYFFSYVVAYAIANANRNGNNNDNRSLGSSMMFYTIQSLLQTVFGIGAQIILMWFSRYREYKADAGSASLNGKLCMIHALQALQRGIQPKPRQDKAYMQALCINGVSSLSELFMSHPPLQKRIAALEAL